MAIPEIIKFPVKPKGQYYIIDSEGVSIGYLSHPDIRDWVVNLMNTHIPNETTLEAIKELEQGNEPNGA